MSTTGTIVKESLPIASLPTDVQIIAAINIAISTSWPAIALTEYAPAAATLVSATYEYSLATLTDIEPDLGVARVCVTPSSGPEITLRAVRQRYDNSTGAWMLVFPAKLASDWNGRAVNITYQHRHAPITTLANTIKLPLDYLISYVCFWHAQRKLSEQSTDRLVFRDLLASNHKGWNDSLLRNQTPKMTPLLHIGKDDMTV